jgi:hypothetical protein
MPRSRNKTPFLIDEDGHEISRTDFRRLRKAQKRQLMVEWFNGNFEDPSISTPRNDGEFTFIWGGPYETRDELYGKFGDLVPEALIEEVAEEVEQDGITDWAPVRKDGDIDEDIDIDEPPSLDDFPDEPGPNYGSPQELEARARARTAASHLEAYLQTIPAGIGHNQPPSQIEAADIEEIRQAAANLTAEFGKQSPSVPAVKTWGKTIRKALIAFAAWTAGVIATLVITDLFGFKLQACLDAILNWLGLATQIPL